MSSSRQTFAKSQVEIRRRTSSKHRPSLRSDAARGLAASGAFQGAATESLWGDRSPERPFFTATNIEGTSRRCCAFVHRGGNRSRGLADNPKVLGKKLERMLRLAIRPLPRVVELAHRSDEYFEGEGEFVRVGAFIADSLLSQMFIRAHPLLGFQFHLDKQTLLRGGATLGAAAAGGVLAHQGVQLPHLPWDLQSPAQWLAEWMTGPDSAVVGALTLMTLKSLGQLGVDVAHFLATSKPSGGPSNPTS